MCGRFIRSSSLQRFARLFGVEPSQAVLVPRYNVAPTQAAVLVRNATWGGRELVSLYWGFVPS